MADLTDTPVDQTTPKNPLQDIYEGLSAKNPQLKQYGFDAFSNDMKDPNNLKQIYDGLSGKNSQLKEYGFDNFKTDMLGGSSLPDTSGKDQSVGISTPVVQKPSPTEEMPSFTEHPIDYLGQYAKNAGNAFVSTGRSALAETGLAVEDQALKINNALKSITPNSWGNYFDKDNSEISQNIASLHKFKDESDKLTGKPGETLGSLLPFVGMAAATMLTKSPTLASATAGAFGEMGYGSGIESYDDFIKNAQTKDPSIKTDEANRTFAGLGYMAAMSIPMGNYLGKMMPKGVWQGVLDGILKDTPEVATKLGSEIFENYAKNNLGAAKQLLTTVAKGMTHGVASMETMELSKKAIDEGLIGKKDGPGWLETMANAAGSGMLFGGLTAPFSAIAQNSATRQRWDAQGSVTLSHDAKGNPFEIFVDKDGNNQGMTPDGKIVPVTQNQVKNSFTIPTDQFIGALNTFDKTGNAPKGMERNAYSGRIKQMTDHISDKDGNIYVAQDQSGNPFYNIGGNKMVDANGITGDVDPSLQWKKVNKGEVWQGLMNSYDQKAESNGSDQSYQPPQSGSQLSIEPIDPRTQVEQDARKFHSSFSDQDTGNLKVVGEITPNGEDTKKWFVKSEQQDNLGNHTYLVHDEQGNQKFLTHKQITGEPQEISQDDFTNVKLQQFDQDQQNQQLIDQSRIIFNGHHYILTGDKSKNGDYEAIGDDNQVSSIPASVVDKIQGIQQQGEQKPEAISRVYEKTEITGTRDQSGIISITDPMTSDQANNLKEEVERSTGGKSTVQSQLIPNDDSTQADSYQVNIIPVSQGQEATSPGTSPVDTVAGSSESPAPSQPNVTTQKFGKKSTAIDIAENDGYDEVVPNDKMTLEKALPALEEEFKGNKDFELQVNRENITIPAENKYRQPTYQNVIKSIRIVPKNVNNSNNESENIPEVGNKAPIHQLVKDNQNANGEQNLQQLQNVNQNSFQNEESVEQPTETPGVSQGIGQSNKEQLLTPKTESHGKLQTEGRNQTSKEVGSPGQEAASNEVAPVSRQSRKPKGLSEIQKQAYKIEVDSTNAYDLAMQWFIGGGKINRQALEYIFGNKRPDNPRIEAERKPRFTWVNNETGLNVDQIAHSLWEEHHSENSNLTDQDFRDAVISVITDYSSPVQMAKDLLKKYDPNKEEFTPEQIQEMEKDGIFNTPLNEEDISFENSGSDIPEEYLNQLGKKYELSPESQTELNNLFHDLTAETTNTETEKTTDHGSQKPESTGKPEQSTAEGYQEVVPNPNQEQIDKVQSEIYNLKKRLVSKEKEVDGRNGLFGDAASNLNDLFGQEEFDTDNARKVIQYLKGEIENKSLEIEKLRKSGETALVENKGQQEISVPDKSKPLLAVLDEQSKAIEGKNLEKIEDFGEKIGGAKKDLIHKYINKINLNGLTLSTIFPKPDIKSLLDSGLSLKDASAIKVAHEFATTDKKRGLKYMIFYASYAKSVLSDSINLEFKSERSVFTDYGKSQLTLRTDAYEKVAKELGNNYLQLDLSRFRIAELTENNIKHYVKKPEGKYYVQYNVDPKKYFDTISEALNHFSELVKKNTTTDTVTKTHKISIYYGKNDSGYLLGYALRGKPLVRIKEGFKSASEAREYQKANDFDLQTMVERILSENKATRNPVTRLKYYNETSRDRVGNDWRKGKDISAKELADKFGFRAVEFGEWANQKERQVFLNSVHDSMMDLSEILNVPPKALSLNGELAVSFGARGSGGAQAHFEPEKRVIALTKTKGVGTLAHEYFHALDNYFADWKSDSKNMKAGSSLDLGKDARGEIKEVFSKLNEILRSSDLKKRSQSLDNLKNKLYFSLTNEMAARSFEDYVLNKLNEFGQINDFLVNYVSDKDWSGLPSQYPYPIGEECKEINNIFDKLFETIETKEDNGNIALKEPQAQYGNPKQSSIGFYSTAEKALGNISQNKGTSDQFKAMLLKNGAKQAELDWMGYDQEFPGNKPVTKEAIQNWINQNMIDVTEVEKGKGELNVIPMEDEPHILEVYRANDPDGEYAGTVGEIIINGPGMGNYKTPQNKKYAVNVPGIPSKSFDTQKEAEDYIKSNTDLADETKYANYVEPGGTNYKELLLTMPSGKDGWEQWKNDKSGKSFRSSHFDEPNILAHVRFDEREVNGEKVLFIEEIQSDWAQKGKKEGFNYVSKVNEEITKREDEIKGIESELANVIKQAQQLGINQGASSSEWNAFENGRLNSKEIVEIDNKLAQARNSQEWNDLHHQKTEIEDKQVAVGKKRLELIALRNNKYEDLGRVKAEIDIKRSNSVPNMPFSKTDQWVNLAFRRMMKYAVDNGFDRIAWTNGEMQAARYNLSKQVKSVNAVNEKGSNKSYQWDLTVTDYNGNPSVHKILDDKELADTIGKDLADKIIADNPNRWDTKTYKDLDLKVGGEGMKAFYDAIIPSAVSKLGKPFGAKVENIDMQFGDPGENDLNPLHLTSEMYDGTQEDFPGYEEAQVGEWLIRDANGNYELTLAENEAPNGPSAIQRYYEIMDENGDPVRVKNAGTQTVQSLPITPSMREEAKNGMPLFEPSKSYNKSVPLTQFLEDSKKQLSLEKEKEVRYQDPITVYHGGSVTSLSSASIENPLFVSEDEHQAKEYTKENGGKVRLFVINNNAIGNEDFARLMLRELDLNSKEEGWDNDELNLFELIDPKFDTSLPVDDIKKLFRHLEAQGIGGIRFYDTNLKTLEQDIENIVIFNPEMVSAAKEKGMPKISNKQVKDIFTTLVNEMSDTPGEETTIDGLLMNWNDSELNEDRDKIKGYSGRDRLYSKGKEGGSQDIAKRDFIDWVQSEEPFEEKKYGKGIRQDKDWVAGVEKAREIISRFIGKENKKNELTSASLSKKDDVETPPWESNDTNQVDKKSESNNVSPSQFEAIKKITENKSKNNIRYSKSRTDRTGNNIGDGTWNIEPHINDFNEYPQIKTSVSNSRTTESTYVTYLNSENGKSITVRFSNHENNATKFGDQLDDMASNDEILFRLGLKKREFIPNKFLNIWTRQVSKNDLINNTFEEGDKTIKELYALGKDADLSDYKGKLAKDSNYLILGDKVQEETEKGRDVFGGPTTKGNFVYSDLENKNVNSDLSLLNESQLSLDFSDAQEYKTAKGETIRYKATGADSYTGEPNVQRKTDKNQTVYCGLERQVNEIGFIQLSGDTKIESPDDVAYLFRSLESAPTENVFAVLHQKDRGFKILYLSTGGTSSSIIDIKLITAAVGEFNAESVTFVHNHPSGNLEASPADRTRLQEMKDALNGIANINPAIIINLDSGKYSVLHSGSYSTDIETRPDQARATEEQAKIYQFNKSILYDNSDNFQQIKGSRDVAQFLSSMKRGTNKKFTVLLLNRQNKITKVFLTDDISPKNIVPMVGKHGDGVIISTNVALPVPAQLKAQLKANNTELLDWIQVQQDPAILSNYKSFADEGLLEPPTKYETKEVNDPGKSVPLLDRLQQAKELTKYIPGVTEGKEAIENFTEALAVTMAPYNYRSGGKSTAQSMRSSLGTMARNMDMATAQLKQAKKYFNRNSTEGNLKFIDNMERGLPQENETLQGYSDALRQQLDHARDGVRNLGTGKLEQFIENYFPHFWEQKGRINEKFSNKVKNPLEGTKSFLKQRTIEFTKDGIKAGLTPISYNPVTLALMKIREMERYIMAHQTLNELKHSGYIRFVKIGRPKPDGFTMIDDKVSRVMVPTDGGLLYVGNWYAEENAARVFNNFLSKGLRGNQLYDLYRGLGNMITQFQLSLSAFHLGFTSFDAAISSQALGWEYLYHGKPIEAAKQFMKTPIAPITNIINGNRLMKAWYGNPSTPEMEEIAKYMEIAGGRAKMDDFYKEQWYDRIIENCRKHRYLSAGLEVPLAILEWTNKPILEHIVPRQKLGVFADMVSYDLKVFPNSSDTERRRRLQKAWDSVDNRMGQLVYDNLFWHHVTKDVLMASVRSVGWNLGTVREVGGAPNELGRIMLEAAKGKTSADTHKIAYAIGLIATTMIASALYQYLRTGKRPEEPRDYFFPKDGEVDKHGDPTRTSMPTYVKDLYHYGNNFPSGALKTLKDKLSPVNGIIIQMMENKDYFGTKIWNEDDPIDQKTKDVFSYMASQLISFGFRNAQKNESDKFIDKVMPFIGFIPAPYDLNMSSTEKLMNDILREKLPVGGRTKQQADNSQMLGKLRNDYQKKGDTDALREALDSRRITFKQFEDVLDDSQISPIERNAKRLTEVELAYVYQQADPKVKNQLADILRNKVFAKMKTDLTDDERSNYEKLLEQIDNDTK